MGSTVLGLESLPLDCLSRVCDRLKLRDLSRLAQVSSHLREGTSVDVVWDEKWRQRWPEIAMPSPEAEGELLDSQDSHSQQASRVAYLDRHATTRQLSYQDFHPSCIWLDAEGDPRPTQGLQEGPEEQQGRGRRRRTLGVKVENLTSVSGCEPQEYDRLADAHLFASVQGSNVSVWSKERSGDLQREQVYRGHTGRVTGLLPFRVPRDSQLFRHGLRPSTSMPEDETSSAFCILTASKDRTIKLWGRSDKPLRTFSGHTADVLCLSDSLLGSTTASAPVCFASGSLDGTVRIWSLSSRGKGKSSCLATLVGHVGPVTALSVPRGEDIGLVSVDSSGKVLFWDQFLSSPSVRNLQDFCAGSVKGPSQSFSLKTTRDLCLLVSKEKIVAYDFRSLQQVWTVEAVAALGLSAFSFHPGSDSFWCGGDSGEVHRCDMRMLPATLCVCEVPSSPVDFLEVDPHKAVSGSSLSSTVKVWDADSGYEVRDHSLQCGNDDANSTQLTALAVAGSLLMFASIGGDGCCVGCHGFEDSSVRLVEEKASKNEARFWGTNLF